MTDEPGTLRLRPGMRGGGPGVMQRTPETPHYDVYRSYYYLGGQRIAQRRQSATLFLDELLYLFTDHLGTVRLETYGNGPSEGQMRAATPTLPYGGQRYAAPESHHWYTGQRFDVGTGLYFYQSRWYDPLVGRFVSPDSIVPNPGNPQSLNRYSYVANNPMRYTDPTGHANECGATGEDCGGGGYVWTPPTAAPSVTGTPAPSFPGAPPVPAPELPAPTPLTSAGTPVPYSSTSSSSTGSSNPRDWLGSRVYGSVVLFDLLWWQLTHVRPGETGAVGAGFDVVAGAGGTVGVAIVLVDGNGNVGILAPQVGFMASTGVAGGGSIWAQGAYAPTIYDQVGGWDVIIGGSAAIGEGGGANIVLSPSDSGLANLGVELSYEVFALDASPITGAELHVGAIYTGQPKWAFNVYDLLEIPRPSQRGLCCQ